MSIKNRRKELNSSHLYFFLVYTFVTRPKFSMDGDSDPGFSFNMFLQHPGAGIYQILRGSPQAAISTHNTEVI